MVGLISTIVSVILLPIMAGALLWFRLKRPKMFTGEELCIIGVLVGGVLVLVPILLMGAEIHYSHIESMRALNAQRWGQ